jgi:hypothetical protein
MWLMVDVRSLEFTKSLFDFSCLLLTLFHTHSLTTTNRHRIMHSIQFIVIACLALFSNALELGNGGLIKKLISVGNKNAAKSEAPSAAPSAAPIAAKAPTVPKAKKDKGEKAGGDAVVSSPPSILVSDFPSSLISDVPSSVSSDASSDLASDAPSV